jgi:hypothetical protein
VYHDGQPYLQTAASGGSPTTPQAIECVWDPILKTYKEDVTEFKLDKKKMDGFKTLFYGVEGWDTATGRPTRVALEASGLGHVADVLEAKGRLGGVTATAAPSQPATASPTKTATKTATTISMKVSAKTATIGKTVTLSGAITPASAIGKNVILYVKKPGKSYWSYSATRVSYKLGSGAAWQYKYAFKKGMAKGTYQFKAVFLHTEAPTVATIKLG